MNVIYRVVGTEERIPIPLMDYILNVVRADLDSFISFYLIFYLINILQTIF